MLTSRHLVHAIIICFARCQPVHTFNIQPLNFFVASHMPSTLRQVATRINEILSYSKGVSLRKNPAISRNFHFPAWMQHGNFLTVAVYALHIAWRDVYTASHVMTVDISRLPPCLCGYLETLRLSKTPSRLGMRRSFNMKSISRRRHSGTQS